MFSNSVNDLKWHMLTLIRTSSNGILNIYVDGVLKTTSSASQSGKISFTSPYLSIGSEHNWILTGFSVTSDQKYYNGVIDDVGIWNRVLTQEEITNLYN